MVSHHLLIEKGHREKCSSKHIQKISQLFTGKDCPVLCFDFSLAEGWWWWCSSHLSTYYCYKLIFRQFLIPAVSKLEYWCASLVTNGDLSSVPTGCSWLARPKNCWTNMWTQTLKTSFAKQNTLSLRARRVHMKKKKIKIKEIYATDCLWVVQRLEKSGLLLQPHPPLQSLSLSNNWCFFIHFKVLCFSIPASRPLEDTSYNYTLVKTAAQ